MSNQQYNTRQIPGVRLESFHSDDGVVVTAARRAQLIHRVDAVICGILDITANQQSNWANCGGQMKAINIYCLFAYCGTE